MGVFAPYCRLGEGTETVFSHLLPSTLHFSLRNPTSTPESLFTQSRHRSDFSLDVLRLNGWARGRRPDKGAIRLAASPLSSGVTGLRAPDRVEVLSKSSLPCH